MTNKELQEYLKQFSDDLPVKWYKEYNHNTRKHEVRDFYDEDIIISSETAHINEDAPEDEWDCEDGKFELGDGPQFILFNAPVD